jgi:uncharacterized membrane protein YsdA (DUF1294 family)
MKPQLAAVTAWFLYRNLDIGLLWVYFIAINAVTFGLFGFDKAASKRDGSGRIPNTILFGLAVVGGALGAVAGMRVFRHKTSRRYRWWRMVVWVSLVAYALLFLRWLL